jgi:hypothetical protein
MCSPRSSRRYLTTRLREDAAWKQSPAAIFQQVKELLSDARGKWYDKGEQIVRDELYEPLFQQMGFTPQKNKRATDDQTQPDYLLTDADGNTISAAFTCAWDRWLDGPDYQLDRDTPDENPGACVVTALEEGFADWIIVTNGRQWRLYSRQGSFAGDQLLRGRPARSPYRLRRHRPQRGVPLLVAVLPVPGAYPRRRNTAEFKNRARARCG